VIVSGIAVDSATGSDDLSGSAINIFESIWSVVTNCYVASCSLGIVADSAKCVISSNTITSVVSAGISIDNATEGSIVTGNVIRIDDGSLSSEGVSVHACQRIIVSNNACDALNFGVTIYGASVGVTIANNVLTNCTGYGVFVNSTASDCMIRANYCYNNGSDTGISNANGDNFRDGGTHTYTIGNSWEFSDFPTSSVFDSGSNSNGSWLKLPDGTMICRQTKTFTSLAITTAVGAIYTSGDQSVTHAVTFYAVPQVFTSIRRNAANVGSHWTGGANTSDTTSIAYFQVMAYSSTTKTVNIDVLAVGRWKA